MSNATKYPTLSEMVYFQWSTPTGPNPRLAAPIEDTDTTIIFTNAPLDSAGVVLTEAFLLGIDRADGYTETVLVPAGGLSVDGLTATGVTRGIKLEGYDYTAAGSGLAVDHLKDSPVYCNITGVLHSVLTQALQGNVATGGIGLTMGTEGGAGIETITIYRTTTAGAKLGVFRWDMTTGKAQFSNDGSSWTSISDTVSSVLAKVSAADTTAGYLEDKIQAGTNITITKINTGGNEYLEIDFANGGITDHIIYTPGFLTGDTGAETNVSLWDSESAASFRATIDGVAANYDGIDFTAGHVNGIVTDMDGVAARIQYEIRAVTGSTETCTWEGGNHFLITSADTTSASAVSVLSTSTGTVGTDISGAGASDWMDADTGNGVATAAVLNPSADVGKIALLNALGVINASLLEITGGIGITVDGNGDIDIDFTDTNAFVVESAGAGDAGKGVILDADGKVAASAVASSVSSQTSLITQTFGTDRYIMAYADIGDSGFTATVTGANGVESTQTFSKTIVAGDAAGRYTTVIADEETFENDGNPALDWDDKWFMVCQPIFVSTTLQDVFMGQGKSTVSVANGVDADATSVDRHCGFFIQDGTIYASNADGSTQTKTDVSGAIDLTEYNTFQIEYTTTSIVFKINGVTVATHTTNIPSGATDFGMVFGIESQTSVTRKMDLARTVVFGHQAS